MPKTRPLILRPGDRALLTELANTPTRAAAGRRARILLLASEGLSGTEIARELGCTRKTVLTWRDRYRTRGLAGLADDPRSGRPSTVSDALVMLPTLAGRPTEGRDPTPWSARGLAAYIGVSPHGVLRVWRRWDVSGDIPTTFPTSPPLPAKATTLTGLYIAGMSVIVALVDGGTQPSTDGRASAWDSLLRALAAHTARNDPWGMVGNQAEFRSFVASVQPNRDRPVHLLTFEPESVIFRTGGYDPNVAVHAAASGVRRTAMLEVLCATALAHDHDLDPVGSAVQMVNRLEAVVAGWGRAAKPFAWRLGAP